MGNLVVRRPVVGSIAWLGDVRLNLEKDEHIMLLSLVDRIMGENREKQVRCLETLDQLHLRLLEKSSRFAQCSARKSNGGESRNAAETPVERRQDDERSHKR